MSKNKVTKSFIAMLIGIIIFSVASDMIKPHAAFSLLETDVAVTAITITPSPASVNIGQTVQLTATISPEGATNKELTWTSNNPQIATISSSGVLTGVSSGSTTILVTNTPSGVSATVTVTVPEPIPVTQVTVNPTTLTLTTAGATSTIVATIAPTNATNKSVTWLSSNEAVATVNNGVVTAVANGTANIIARSTDNTSIEAVTQVTVALTPVSVTGISLNRTTLSFTTAGATETLVATIAPSNATNKSITWLSTTPTVASVSTNGVVTAVSNGTTTIFVTTVDGGFTAQATVTVALPVSVTNISLNKASFILSSNGATETLIATITPENATNKNVTWTSANPAIATVSTSGVVTAVSNGSTIITATTADGNRTASATVTVAVVVEVSGVTLNKSALTFNQANQTEQLIATIAPANATNKNITWSSSNANVATVNASGVVTALRNGTATITAMTQDGNKTATATVTVNIVVPVSSITLVRNSVTITQENETVQLNATVNPSNATNKTLTYRSSNNNVATVSNTGLVTPVGNGTTTITITSNNNVSTQITIVVNIGSLYTMAEIIQNSSESWITLSDLEQTIIDQEIISILMETQKTLVLESLNMSGEVAVRWVFDGTLLLQPTSIDTQVVFASDDQLIIQQLSNQQQGIILAFGSNPTLQEGISIYVNVSGKFEPSDMLNLYFYNPVNQTLELTSQYLLVNEESFVYLPLTHTSTYLLTTPIEETTVVSSNVSFWVIVGLVIIMLIAATAFYIVSVRKKLKSAMEGF